MPTRKNNHNILLSPFKLTLIYLIVAGLWIAFTDRMLNFFISDLHALSILQTYKGWGFVVVTGLGLYWLIKQHDRQLLKQKEKREHLTRKLQSEKELRDIIFERIPILITIYDPDLNKFEVNNEFEKVTGWTNKDISKQNVELLKAIYPDQETRKEAVKLITNPRGGWKEFSLKTKNGKKIPTSWTNIRLTDDTSVGIGINMTDIKVKQTKIRESQELLKKSIESLKSSLIIVDLTNRTIVDCNTATEEVFGYRANELIGNSTKTLHINEEKFRQFNEMGAEALEKEGVFQTQFQMQKKDGTVFYTDHTVTLVYDENNDIEKAVSIIRDITEQKRKEQELKKRQERLLRSQNIGKIGDWEFEIATKEISWSPTMFDIFERNPERGTPSIKKIRTDYFGTSSPLHNRALQQAIAKNESYDIDLELKTEKGNNKYIRAIGIPRENKEGAVTKILGVVQDITERKRFGQKLRESEEKYRHLFKNNPQPMWIYNPDTLNFIEVNKAAVNHYEYSEEEFMKMTLLDVYPAKDVEELKRTVEKNRGLGVYAQEWMHLKKDGTKINVEVSAADVSYGDKRYRLVLINDITKQKKMQEKIIQSVIEGEDRERKRIAHELHDGLGQFLVASSMNLQSVEAEIEELSDRRQKQFKTGLSLLKDALTETRSIAYNLMPKVITDYGLLTALQNLIRDLRKSTDINFTFHCNCKTMRLKNEAGINIYRISQEAISNAVRHAACSTIWISLMKTDNKLQLTIEDNGKGLPLTSRDEEQGLGLRSITTRVSSLNGSVNIESEPDEGTKISISIPNLNSLVINGGSDE